MLSGCATRVPSTDAVQYVYARGMLQVQRESSLRSSWRGKSYRALLVSFGNPTLTMDIPGRRHLPSSVAVYEVTDKASDCIDAFSLVTVADGETVVADYFCR